MQTWHNYIQNRYDHISPFRERYPRVIANSRLLKCQGKAYLNFVSNDYLGLGLDSRLRESAITASEKFGIGSSGAPTLSGYSVIHEGLSKNLSNWLGFDKALLFSSGYHLNIGIYSQLTDINSHVWLDRNCHASHLDGIILAKARFTTFHANEFDNVYHKILNSPKTRHLVLSEGLFSMDGTCNYLTKLIKLKQHSPDNLLLILDDAHGIGTLGEKGFGTLEQLHLDHKIIDLYIGTLGKAFASHGGFVCGKTLFIDYLQQTTRSQLFSTALPPLIAAAANTALEIISSAEGAALRQRLQANILYFLKQCEEYKLPIANYKNNLSPIQLVLFDNYTFIDYIFNNLLKQGIRVGKILYPTVPRNKPRLRISLTLDHTHDDIFKLCTILSNLVKECNSIC